MAEIYGREVCEKSFAEMRMFAREANAAGELPLLFGGWAVYHYNSYAGSRDVDFVVSDEKLDGFIDFLAGRGYMQRQARLYKEGVFFDLYKKSEEIGSVDNKLPFKLLYEEAENVYLKPYYSARGREEVLVPTKARLLYFKLHALASRSVAKDRSDAIAVLLKTDESELLELKAMLSETIHLLNPLISLRNDLQSLSLVAEPTKKLANILNAKIKTLTSLR